MPPSRRLLATDLAQIAVFAAFIAVLGLMPGIYVFSSAVPITLQTLGVMLTGCLLGSRRAALTLALFIVLVAVGFPLLAGGRGGIGVFFGPSGGFVIGWLVGAYVTGLIVERSLPKLGFVKALLACLAGGVVAIYAIGIPYWAVAVGSLTTAAVQSLAFIPGDVAKAVIVSLIAVAVHRAYPTIVPVAKAHAARADVTSSREG
ncbi:biotin transporter BioY [Fodinicola acaciae]|uniref:biotin transporter BioY n=1 Tax=Fodinicola acaciae TaxID=2681555 RepID=UPI0013D5635B|nr:biotin transporter BioY [Fodinicola acaciae]